MANRKLDLREGLPLEVDPCSPGTLLMLVPGGEFSRIWNGPAYLYLMTPCPGCNVTRSRIFAVRAEWTVRCHLCGWQEDDDQFKEPAYVK